MRRSEIKKTAENSAVFDIVVIINYLFVRPVLLFLASCATRKPIHP
ncbi:hypothetical protein SAMN04488097_2499 [Epilithonimonas lactis]|nr:hypothetical protein SAMN04488097_2499 [Epilithonimonas lactis]